MIPAGLLVTVPVPVPAWSSDTVRVKLGGGMLNVAVTDSAAAIVTKQLPVPVHAPLQPANTDPVAGVSNRVTIVPPVKLAEQPLPQLIPVGSLVTVPASVPAFVTVNVNCGAAVTVSVAVPVRIPSVAVIVTGSPTWTPVANPCVPVTLPIVTTLVFDELHVAVVVKFCVVPSL
jgi:hypothetical protein